MRKFEQGRGRGRLGYVVLAALGMVLLAPFYGGMWLYYTHATCGPDRMALHNVTSFEVLTGTDGTTLNTTFTCL